MRARCNGASEAGSGLRCFGVGDNHGPTTTRVSSGARPLHRRAVRESVQLEAGVEVQQHCFQRQSISRGRAIQWLPTFAWMTRSKRRGTHVARRGRSMGATVGACHAAPMQSRKQASAGPTPDARLATIWIVSAIPAARSRSPDRSSALPPCQPADAASLHRRRAPFARVLVGPAIGDMASSRDASNIAKGVAGSAEALTSAFVGKAGVTRRSG
jgi:hypothetical protein